MRKSGFVPLFQILKVSFRKILSIYVNFLQNILLKARVAVKADQLDIPLYERALKLRYNSVQFFSRYCNWWKKAGVSVEKWHEISLLKMGSQTKIIENSLK